MDQLPIRRDEAGRLCFEGVGPVSIRPDYTNVLGEGGQGVVVLGHIFSREGAPIREVGALTRTVSYGVGMNRASGR